ncbi:uncharacterized protein LOC127263920 [Andrographis paniculata]|uniref:uncharacterized protein LOC127263920 n=1 Tax=Andrographis paniculata TaxID=175694 RepID=UPI0021E7A5C3|nr:uncharacterized protein LOC127263920 [Andrographis paniculata]
MGRPTGELMTKGRLHLQIHPTITTTFSSSSSFYSGSGFAGSRSLKTLLVFPSISRLVRPAKSLLLKLLVSMRDDTAHYFPKLQLIFRKLRLRMIIMKTMKIISHTKQKKEKKNNPKKVAFFGSFRLHYNWCNSSNSHVMPLGLAEDNVVKIDDNHGDEDDELALSLSRYLEWLEENKNNNKNKDDDEVDDETECCNDHEIDKLADLFIANCHEKFRLEKQESYRRFLESSVDHLIN